MSREGFPWKRWAVRSIQVTLDVIVLAFAFTLSYLVRFDFAIPHLNAVQCLQQLPYVILIEIAFLGALGVYRFLWQYVGLRELKVFVYALSLSALPMLLVRLSVPVYLSRWQIPLSVILINSVFGLCGVLSLRLTRRLVLEYHGVSQRPAKNGRKRVLLVGAGSAGFIAAKELQSRRDANLTIEGFVDDDASKYDSVIHGVRVLGTTSDIPRLAKEKDIDHVIITIAEASTETVRNIVDICERVPIKVRIIPGLYEILEGKVEVSRIRDVQIEDLLGRQPVSLDKESLDGFIRDKVVMVTGAGGSIGSELVRQVSRLQPSQLLLVERAEFALFTISREVRETFPLLQAVSLLADVGDASRMQQIFSAYGPKVVLHAAAHKHVPLMESNAAEAVKNNVIATRRIAEVAGANSVEVFVLISTDKAVRPTSVMGASKRLAELSVQDLNGQFLTRFLAVRFGNVIGSTGSVIPIFRQQIRRGGPVTVTHPDMVRYFMTIPEAAQLVLQAATIGASGEILILDMGQPIRIFDLAKDLITLSGFRPFDEINIVFSGIRPGEKLVEELEMTDEGMTKTRHPKIFIGKIASYPSEQIQAILRQLSALAREGDDQKIRLVLNEALPEAHLTIDETYETQHYAAGA